MHWRTLIIAALMIPLVSACAKRPALTPNSDPALRRTSAEFAADSAKRAPFNTDAPVGEPLDGRARVDYGLKTIQLANLSTTEWRQMEVWVNYIYVVYIPLIEPGTLRTLNFQMFYDARGNRIPTRITEPNIDTVHVYMDGTIHPVRIVLAE